MSSNPQNFGVGFHSAVEGVEDWTDYLPETEGNSQLGALPLTLPATVFQGNSFPIVHQCSGPTQAPGVSYCHHQTLLLDRTPSQSAPLLRPTEATLVYSEPYQPLVPLTLCICPLTWCSFLHTFDLPISASHSPQPMPAISAQLPPTPPRIQVMQNAMLSAARTPHPVQNSDGPSILLGQNNPVPPAPVLLIVSQMPSSTNHVMDIDDSLVLLNEMSHCEQDTTPITPSPPSYIPSSRRTAVLKPPKIFWAKPYVFTAKKIDNRANNATKQLKVAMAEANSTAGL